MSRAWEKTIVHGVADDRAQALEDLHREWSYEKRPQWAIDRGEPVSELPYGVRLMSHETAKRLDKLIDHVSQRAIGRIELRPPDPLPNRDNERRLDGHEYEIRNRHADRGRGL
jgi:hypothetical protein